MRAIWPVLPSLRGSTPHLFFVYILMVRNDVRRVKDVKLTQSQFNKFKL